jgi:hypothetical protein
MSEVKSRGRPRKEKNIIEIKDLTLEFIITKEDDYQNEISFIKVIDKSFKTKLAPILSQKCDECKLPIWKSDDGIYMLKCKNKWMPEGRVFEKNELFTADLNFHYYAMAKNEELIQGYFVKIYTNDVVFDST